MASAAATTGGTWTLGDLSVNRIGFGAMRLREPAISATWLTTSPQARYGSPGTI
jgi:hypothetical protein